MDGKERLDLGLDRLHQHPPGAVPQNREQRIVHEARSWPRQGDNSILLHGVSSRVTPSSPRIRRRPPQPPKSAIAREHLREVVCGGDHYRYLIHWCAYCVQHPEKPAEVAVVMRGKKGCGKGTVAKVMLRIFRDHALQITQARHLTGNEL